MRGLALALLLLSIALAGCGATPAEAGPKVDLDDRIPAFSAVDVDGVRFDSSQAAGRVFVLQIVHSDGLPAAYPVMANASRRLDRDATLLATVAWSDAGEPTAPALRSAREAEGGNWTLLPDDGQAIYRQFRPNGGDAVWIADQSGVVRTFGRDASADCIVSAVGDLLNGAEPTSRC